MFKGVGGSAPRISYVVAPGSQINANLRTLLVAQLGGAPTEPCDVTVLVQAGVVLSGGGGAYGLRIGTGWTTGTTFSIINYGYICGVGGSGGSGADGSPSNGGDGSNGGDAFYCEGKAVTVANYGFILCGVGGGGGGGYTSSGGHGGGGGGGRGSDPGTGGGAGGGNAQDGSDGSISGSGGGGAGATDGAIGPGGAGGLGGQAGHNGWMGAGGAAGASGRAVYLGGEGSVTFTVGGSSPNLQGDVS